MTRILFSALLVEARANQGPVRGKYTEKIHVLVIQTELI